MVLTTTIFIFNVPEPEEYDLTNNQIQIYNKKNTINIINILNNITDLFFKC